MGSAVEFEQGPLRPSIAMTWAHMKLPKAMVTTSIEITAETRTLATGHICVVPGEVEFVPVKVMHHGKLCMQDRFETILADLSQLCVSIAIFGAKLEHFVEFCSVEFRQNALQDATVVRQWCAVRLPVRLRTWY